MSGKNGLQAVVAGHICLDITPNFSSSDKKDIRDIFAPGKLTNVSGAQISLGGAVANTGIALSVLGVNTKLMGKVGDDYFGEGVLKLLRERSVDDGMLVVDGAGTSYSIVIVPPGTDRIFLHDPGANNTFCADDINYDIVSQAKIFHFGYPPIMKRLYENDGRELIKVFKRVKEMGLTTSLDMCLPDAASEAGRVDWEKILKELLPYVDIFIPSIEETMYMVQRDEYIRLNTISKGRDIIENLDMNKVHEIGQKLRTYGAKIIVLKCGIKGYYVHTGGTDVLASMGKAVPGDLTAWANRELIEETFHVSNVVSTTGSGDSSIAGFLAGFLNGMSIEDTLKIACAVGAQCVQAYDAVSGIKSLTETVDLIKKGWEKNRITIEGSYWQYDDSMKTWVGKNDKIKAQL